MPIVNHIWFPLQVSRIGVAEMSPTPDRVPVIFPDPGQMVWPKPRTRYDLIGAEEDWLGVEEPYAGACPHSEPLAH